MYDNVSPAGLLRSKDMKGYNSVTVSQNRVKVVASVAESISNTVLLSV